MTITVRAAGDRGLLVELPAADDVHGLTGWLREQAFGADLEDVVPGTRTVLVIAAPAVLASVSRAVEHAPAFDAAVRTGRTVEIPVVYDGVDLDAVCERLGCGRADFVRDHQQAEHTVAYFGFSPGLAFIEGVPDWLRLPRRDSPRVAIPAGSLAMANEFTIVYPGGTPGGWHLIGTATGPPLWQPDRTPPNLLEVGDRVVFVEQR